MKITYYHKNIDSLGAASRSYIEERIDHLARIKPLDSVRVEIDRIKSGDFHMSVQVNCGRDVFYADATTGDVQSCIDVVEEELKVQMRRKKKKIRDLMKRGARSLKKTKVRLSSYFNSRTKAKF